MEQSEEQKVVQAQQAQRFTVVLFALFSMGFLCGLIFGAVVMALLFWWLGV